MMGFLLLKAPFKGPSYYPELSTKLKETFDNDVEGGLVLNIRKKDYTNESQQNKGFFDQEIKNKRSSQTELFCGCISVVALITGLGWWISLCGEQCNQSSDG